MPKPTPEVVIDTLSHEGRGLTTVNGKKVFVRGALPAETVKIRYTRHNKQYKDANTIEVISPAANRIDAKCPHFGTCGGCLLQHLSSADQITHKQSVLQEQFEHFGNTQPEAWLMPITAEPWHYRHKARVGLKYVKAKEKVVIGFREIDARFVADLHACPILHPKISSKLTTLAEMVQSLSIYNAIPQLEIAVGDNDETAIIVRHLQDFTSEDLLTLCTFAKEHDLQFYLQSKGPDTIHKLTPDDKVEYLTYTNHDYDLTYRFHPADFTQVNPAINQLMVKQALSLLDLNNDDTVLDLFCGLGNFSLAMAKMAKTVVGVEGCSKMVKRATDNAALNTLNNCEFYVSDLSDLNAHATWVRSYSKLLLDPPRTGAEAIVKSISHFGTPDIVYVSCNPATLARDAGILCQSGYRMIETGIMDMFPHTGHIESIAHFMHKDKG